ncbi:hypothetical protein SEA_COMRADE_182 [Streptomyces phage Comrade]|uniref:Uncharacterized protein n=1 Tax=Streptomyces phage Comrade TaxID=2301714 RepID=A0A385DVJ3_9CAUD|nr:hypothetical protein HWB84_gp094 [Streptomyces phage Comrade]AXQ63421.1 hypothetical protein SEA_COMRADE_182 [Streptomyces phage Comrade]
MIQIGIRVRVLDNYSGGLGNTIGRTGKVLRASSEGLYLLDIKGSRKASWGDYTYERDVIVKADEIEPVSFDLKDAQGRKIELGDKVAYGPLGGGVTIGTVVDIDEREGRYGYKTTKFRLETNGKDYFNDGGDRTISGGHLKTYRWYEHSGRCVIIEKNPINADVFELRSVPMP